MLAFLIKYSQSSTIRIRLRRTLLALCDSTGTDTTGVDGIPVRMTDDRYQVLHYTVA